MAILSKVIRVFGIIGVMLVLAVIGSILAFDPPPFRLQDDHEFVLSVTPPAPLGKTLRPIEDGLACKQKLVAYTSGLFGRPVITVFDWLKRQSGALPDQDYHLSASKPNAIWAIRIDRAANKFCWFREGDAKVGLTDAYCGPTIVRESATVIEAIEQGVNWNSIAFDKTTYTLMMIGLESYRRPPVASISYFECR
jgi:hypothetical protein